MSVYALSLEICRPSVAQMKTTGSAIDGWKWPNKNLTC